MIAWRLNNLIASSFAYFMHSFVIRLHITKIQVLLYLMVHIINYHRLNIFFYLSSVSIIFKKINDHRLGTKVASQPSQLCCEAGEPSYVLLKKAITIINNEGAICAIPQRVIKPAPQHIPKITKSLCCI